MQGLIPQTPLPLTFALFLMAALVVWFSGGRLVAYADEIADRMRIGTQSCLETRAGVSPWDS